MAESEKLETLIYCLGTVGGPHNIVCSFGSGFKRSADYTTAGFARYIKEANNVVEYMQHIINHFMELVKDIFAGDPLEFIDAESDENMKKSIKKMKKKWKEMFKDHQKNLKHLLQDPKLKGKASTEKSETSSFPEMSSFSSAQVSSFGSGEVSSYSSAQVSSFGSGEASSCSSARLRSSYSAKQPRSGSDVELDPEYSIGSETLVPESDEATIIAEPPSKSAKLDPEVFPETGEKVSKPDPEAASKQRTPVDEFDFPENIFIKEKKKSFSQVLGDEYQVFKRRMQTCYDRLTYNDTRVREIKGFTLSRMNKFAKWKYSLKMLSYLIKDLEEKFGEVDLREEKEKPNEKRLTKWLYFDDGDRDRKYYHRLLIPATLIGPIDEMCAVAYKQLRRWHKMEKELGVLLPEEHKKIEAKTQEWKHLVLYRESMYRREHILCSSGSDDTFAGCPELPPDTPE